MTFIRTYNSYYTGRSPAGLSTGWTHTFDRGIVTNAATSPTQLYVMRADGKLLAFTLSGSLWIPLANVTDQLTETSSGGTPTGWTYVVAKDDSVETYSGAGVLTSIAQRNGQTTTLTYSTSSTPTSIAPGPGYLITVTDAFGRALQLTYPSTFLGKLTDPSGLQYQYAFDTNYNNVSITYPDTFTRSYFYNEPANVINGDIPYALTGIQDENNNRYSTYQYQTQGLATTTQLAGGVNNFSLSYTVNGYNYPTQAAVTDPLNTTRQLTFTIPVDINAISSISQSAGAGSAAATSTMTYDVNGNTASTTDFNGNSTCSAYNLTTNEETSRLEGIPPGVAISTACVTPLAPNSTYPLERLISTQWHSIWHLPIKRAGPLNLTTYAYNGDGGVYCAPTTAKVNGNPIGVLCKKTEQATTDANGSAGLSPTTTGTARVWSYTYNANGQVLTAVDPDNNTTTTTYYASTDTAHTPPYYYIGDIETVKNALGQITTNNQYDGNGRLLKMTDPNSVVTTFTYKPRGWLAAKVVTTPSSTTETTTYSYDNTGQLTQVTLPDSTYIKYAYDPAHRLTTITDSAGDSINYTLDAMGNRVTEATKDPNANLTRNIVRVMDALNRLQTVTGAIQ